MIRRFVLLVPTFLLVMLVSGCGPTQSEIEKSIRDNMKSSLGVSITSFDLKKQSDGSYAGTATAQNGDVYEVSTSPPKGNAIEWKAIPGEALVKKTLRAELEKQLAAKVTGLDLTRKEPGKYTGTATFSTGEQLTVNTHMDGTTLKMEWVPVAGKR